MARCRFIHKNFRCLSCSHEWRQGMWIYFDSWDQSKNTDYPSVCPNPSCTVPHISIIPSVPRGPGYGAQVRESQRTIVYLTPDGDYMVPPVTDPSDPAYAECIETCRSGGGIRMEFTSLSEMRQFQRTRMESQREEWLKQIDTGEFGVTTPDFQQLQKALYSQSRNQILEYDQKSLESGHDRIRENISERKEQRERFQEKFRSLKIGRHGDSKRYERLRSGIGSDRGNR